MSRLPREIETERLVLKLTTPDMLGVYRDAIMETLWDLKPWMAWAHPTPNDANTYEYLSRSEQGWADEKCLQLAIFRKEDGRFIGNCSLNTIHMDIPSADIGYWCRSSEQGKGYIKEATCALRDWMLAFGFKRIQIRANVANHASRYVASACGFKQEAILKENQYNPYRQCNEDIVYYRYPVEKNAQ